MKSLFVYLAVVDYEYPEYIGVFDTAEEAKAAAVAYVRGYYGEEYSDAMEFEYPGFIGECLIDEMLKIYLEEVPNNLKG